MTTTLRSRVLRLLPWVCMTAVFVTSYVLAFVIDLGPPATAWTWHLRRTLPLVLGLKLGAVAVFGLDRSLWRYAGLRDLTRTALGVVAGSAALVAAELAAGLPRWNLPLLAVDFLLSMVLLGAVRVLPRLWREGRHGRLSRRRLLVIGAGDAGETAVRELLRRPSEYRPVGFVDDDPRKVGRHLHGVRVEAGVDRVEEIARRLRADAVLVAVCSASGGQMRRLLERARATGLPVKRIPSLGDLIAGRERIDQLRDIGMDELLPRRAVRTDRSAQAELLAGKVVLVTGAAGSIGSELSRQILACGPRRLLVLDKDENALFRLEHELKIKEGGERVLPILASVGDPVKMRAVFAAHRPAVVFHAAAYKHVPVLEHFPEEAVRNNVHGTRVTAEMAHLHGAEAFVLISTDKAVRPTSVMGASKRIAELVVGDFDLRSSTRFTTIRFGNVLGSNGSVIQLFTDQIARGGPVTVTHPEIRRFFMTIPEAVDLVLFGAALGRGGTFILDMGEQIRVLDMAHHLIRLHGLQPEVDVPVSFTGLRPGEKMYEELWMDEEEPRPTDHPSILQAPRPLLDRRTLQEEVDRLISWAEGMDRAAVVCGIRNLVPDYSGEPVGLESAAAPAVESEAAPRLQSVGRAH